MLNRKKIVSGLTIFAIIVLLIGFIFMSLILIDILKVVNGVAKDFIEFIRDFFLKLNALI